MKWKKFKEETLGQRFTIMLLPHSRQKPIHFKVPAWGLGLLFALTACMIGGSVYLACSASDIGRVNGRLKELEAEKLQIEAQKLQIEQEKREIIWENTQLRGDTAKQEQMLKDLEGKAEEAIQELGHLYERENELRAQAGLEAVEIPQELSETMSAMAVGSGSQEGAPGQSTAGDAPEAGGDIPVTKVQVPLGEVEADQVLSTQIPQDIVPALYMRLPQGMTELDVASPPSNSGSRGDGYPSGGDNPDWNAVPALSREAHVIERKLAVFQTEATRKNRSYNEVSQALAEAARQEAAEKAILNRRQRIAEYALQFVGNSYVWGGNDPHTGVDCSGFTKYVIQKMAGVDLPRTAATQYNTGKTVTIDEARPGDLVFYYGNGYINHVAMYIGDGKVVHAASRKSGIKVSSWDYRKPIRIKNVVGD